MTPEHIIRRPIALTEKVGRLKEQNKVVSEVDPDANKIQIKEAVEALFDVKVADVNTLIQRGK
jgi:large subunit ribosomal protein L23